MSNLSFGKKKKRIQINYELLLKILGWIFQIALVCFLAFLLVWYFGRKAEVVGDSMNPNLKHGDVTLVNTLVYETREPERGEVIAFWPNGNRDSHCYISRIIGLPGETVSLQDGKIFINGEALSSKYQQESMTEMGLLEEPIVLKKGEYFVLGDYRDVLDDSRTSEVGNVKKEEIFGKVWTVVSPMKHIGVVK